MDLSSGGGLFKPSLSSAPLIHSTPDDGCSVLRRTIHEGLEGRPFKVMIPKVAQNSIQGSFRLGYAKYDIMAIERVSLLALRHYITNPNRVI